MSRIRITKPGRIILSIPRIGSFSYCNSAGCCCKYNTILYCTKTRYSAIGISCKLPVIIRNHQNQSIKAGISRRLHRNQSYEGSSKRVLWFVWWFVQTSMIDRVKLFPLDWSTKQSSFRKLYRFMFDCSMIPTRRWSCQTALRLHMGYLGLMLDSVEGRNEKLSISKRHSRNSNLAVSVYSRYCPR